MTKKTIGPADEQKADKRPVTPMAFDILEFCEAYRVGRSSAYEEIREGRLKIFKVGKLTRISVEAAENWRRQREEVATLDPPPARRTGKAPEAAAA